MGQYNGLFSLRTSNLMQLLADNQHLQRWSIRPARIFVINFTVWVCAIEKQLRLSDRPAKVFCNWRLLQQKLLLSRAELVGDVTAHNIVENGRRAKPYESIVMSWLKRRICLSLIFRRRFNAFQDFGNYFDTSCCPFEVRIHLPLRALQDVLQFIVRTKRVLLNYFWEVIP